MYPPVSGIVKKRFKKLSLTKKGKTLISDDTKLLHLIIDTFMTKFNWAYYDGYSEEAIGQMGIGFSLILLSKYGNKKRLDKFYAKKYFIAYPHLIDQTIPLMYGTYEETAYSTYSLRTFKRFLDYFGLITIESPTKPLGNSKIIKTELFDKLIQCKPHRNNLQNQSH